MVTETIDSQTTGSVEHVVRESTVPEMTDRRYQGIGRRAVAVVVDGAILSVAYAIIGYAVAAATGGFTPTGFALEGAPAFLVFALTMIVGFGYFIGLEARSGQTIGKRLMGIRVVSEDGTPITMQASAVRNVLRVVDGLFVYLVGTVFVATSEKKQRLGDRLADTVVVRA